MYNVHVDQAVLKQFKIIHVHVHVISPVGQAPTGNHERKLQLLNLQVATCTQLYIHVYVCVRIGTV